MGGRFPDAVDHPNRRKSTGRIQTIVHPTLAVLTNERTIEPMR